MTDAPAGARTPLRRLLAAGLALAGVALAAYLVHRALRGYSFAEIVDSLRALPFSRMAVAGGFVAASYLCLTGFDALAIRYVGRAVPYRRVALASFTGLSIGHTLGFAALSSGAVRYRFYSRFGLDAEEIAKIILFCGVTVALGLATLGGAVCLARGDLVEQLTGLDGLAVIALGAGCVAFPAGYLILALVLRRPLKVRSWRFAMPAPRIALAQVAIGAANFACVGAALHQLLGAAGPVDYAAVLSVFVIANLLAIVSHVPGGLGVIESVVALLLPGMAVIGPLIAYRVLYYLGPFALGLICLGASEIVFRGTPAGAARRDGRLAEQS